MIARAFHRLIAALCFTMAMSLSAHAVNPEEILDDPALEQRARDISINLRCLVCQNQSIDDSDAELAKDLRVLVRERLVEGDSNQEVLDFVVARYGEFVLLRPQFSARNLALWGTPLVVLILGGFAAYNYGRTHRVQPANTILSAEEEKRLAEILDDRDTDRS